jgi:hypothetical protein
MSETYVWAWSDAAGCLNVYEKSISGKIEAAFRANAARVAVDDERYIDLTTLRQCRVDNPKKSREVKRVLLERDDSTTVCFFFLSLKFGFFLL